METTKTRINSLTLTNMWLRHRQNYVLRGAILLFALVLFLSSINILSVKADSSFSISPSLGNYIYDCASTAIVAIDVTTGQSNAADIIIHYDPTKIEILDSNPSISGIQIEIGTAFESYVGNSVNVSTGEIKLIGYSTSGTVSGTAEFATIHFKPLNSAGGTGGFQIEFTGADPYNTLDSNIADASTAFDMLSSIQNSSYTFSSGACSTDSTPPQIIFNAPKNFSQNVPGDSTIKFTVSDGDSGVDISQIKMYLNGETYMTTDPEVSISGTPSSYQLIIIPRTPIPTTSQSVITVTAADNAGNNKSSSITINPQKEVCPEIIKEIVKSCPEIPTTTPPSTTTPKSPIVKIISDITKLDVSNTTLIIQITDDTGIAPESFLLQIGGKTYSVLSTPELISVNGTKLEYTFELELDLSDLEKNENGLISGFIRISDIDGNTRIENIKLETNITKVNNTPNSSASINSSNYQKILLTLSLGIVLALGLSLLLSAMIPGIIVVKDSQTKKLIAFPKAFIKTNDNKISKRVGLFNGKVIGRLPKNGENIIIQKYGYKDQIINIKENQAKLNSIIKVLLVKL